LLESRHKLLPNLIRGRLEASQIGLFVLNGTLSEKQVLGPLWRENVIVAGASTTSGEVLLLLKDEVELSDNGAEDVPHPAGSSFLNIDRGNLLSSDDDLEGTFQDLPDSLGKLNLNLFARRGGRTLAALGLGGGGSRGSADIGKLVLEFLDVNVFQLDQIGPLRFPGDANSLADLDSLASDGGERNANNALTLNTEDQLVLAVPGSAGRSHCGHERSNQKDCLHLGNFGKGWKLSE
jgi:hypothetical protein